MKPETHEENYNRWQKALPILRAKGWNSLGGWIFEKNGLKYDLSAADIEKIDWIEEKGYFRI